MSENKLTIELKRLFNQPALENMEYFQFSLFSNEEGKFHYSYMSNWFGYDDENPNIELREPSLMIIDKAIKIFQDIDQPLLIINDKKDLFLFLNFYGGNGLITKELCEQYLADTIKPQKNVKTYDKSYINFEDIPKNEFNRAPNPKLRMEIFKRDNFKCKVCGASPQNNEHVELHLHHITPYSYGGLTQKNNLITLCHTCHKGLEPHYDPQLYSFINVEMLCEVIPTEKYKKRIERNILFGIKRYKEKTKTTANRVLLKGGLKL
ncbi:HNH endonuclease [Algoriella xinjiangensis]|uniref:HNH endonuclease n=1 Tax=Algoriella xinjiangensis TaxID=684065 RepID=UPI000F643D54|nr:HNH endonuclease [Algoriella xinjiangensis]VDH15493.1 HNH endonuclease [Algoriella xinjiangensis]